MSVWSASHAGEPLQGWPRPGAEAKQPDSLASAVSWASIAAGAAAAASLPVDDSRYVAQIVAQRSGLSQQDAQTRVAEVYGRAQAKASSLDIVELGARMAARKDDLIDQAA